MTLTELKYIVALADEKHFGNAAERCLVSQPTLSIAVKRLEDELDIAIFERGKNGVEVTPLGKKIVEQAQEALLASAKIRDIAKSEDDSLIHPLRLGAIFTIGPYLFPRFLPTLQELAPDMPLYLEENFTETLKQRLIHAELDAIIVALPFTEKDVVTQKLFDERFVAIVPANHPLAKKQRVQTKDFQDENILMLGEGHCLRDQVIEVCSTTRDGDARSTTIGSSLETLKYMISSGLGVCILPESAASVPDSLEDKITVVRFEDSDTHPEPKRGVALAWRASYPRFASIDLVSKAIRKNTQTLAVS